jgi:hypothetical protein
MQGKTMPGGKQAGQIQQVVTASKSRPGLEETKRQVVKVGEDKTGKSMEVQQVMQTGKARFGRHVDALVKVRQANRAKAWDRERDHCGMYTDDSRHFRRIVRPSMPAMQDNRARLQATPGKSRVSKTESEGSKRRKIARNAV